MKKPKFPNFSDKVVALYLAGGSSVAMHSPTFETQAGRLFLVGIVPKGPSRHWAVGARSCVAWESVDNYYLIDSVENYRDRQRPKRKPKI